MNRLRVKSALILAFVTLIAAVPTWAQLTDCSVASVAPVAADDHVQWPNGPVVIDVLGNDYDANGDILVISFVGTPTGGGTAVLTSDGEAVRYTPPAGGTGPDQFTYTVSDGAFTASGTVRISAQLPPVTDPPIPDDPDEPPPTEPPPGVPRVWFDYTCTRVTCYFNANWENIPDAPRYFHWVFPNGTTPPYYNSRGALADFSGPGTHYVSVLITFVSGIQYGSGSQPIQVPVPTVDCAFQAPATTPGLSLTTSYPTTSNMQSPDFPAYRYFWEWGDGHSYEANYQSVLQTPGSHTYNDEGLYTVRFLIKTADGNVAGQCAQIVDVHNSPPSPSFTATYLGPSVDPRIKRVQFYGSALDEHQQLGDFEWNFGDGTFLAGERYPLHVYTRPGTYTVVMKVTDLQGLTGTYENTVTVPDVAPVPFWLYECRGRRCTFDASDSVDDSEVMTFRWDFADGTPVVSTMNRVVEHLFPGDGPYDVKLTVDDGTNQVVRILRISPREAPLAKDLVYYTLPPCRLVETAPNSFGLSPSVPVDFPAAGRCGIPAEAKAIAVNLTVDSTVAGYLFLYPTGAAVPITSAINFNSSLRSNFFITTLGTSGGITANGFANTGTGVMQLTVDVVGYFTDQLTGLPPSRGPLRYGSHFSARALDTRSTGQLTSGTPKRFSMHLAANPYAFPPDAQAHILRIRPVNLSGTYTLYPSDLPAPPRTASLAFGSSGMMEIGHTIMGLGNQPADDLGIVFTSTQANASTHVVVDSAGWFARNSPGRYYAVQPCRAVDTRQPGTGVRVPANDGRSYQLRGNCGVPREATAIVTVVRIVNADADGHAFVGGFDTAATPDWWTIAYRATDIIANTHILAPSPLPWDGRCCTTDVSVFVNQGGGADVVLDVLGYFMPEENLPPVPVADSVNAVVNVPITIDVVANDRDPNADPLRLSPERGVFNPPTLGTATRASDTSITYTATAVGTDSFDYEVVDSRGGYAHGKVKVIIRATNEAPVAVNDSTRVASAGTITVDVVANDTDPNQSPIRLSPNAVVAGPWLGTASRASDRSITYIARDGVGGDDSLTYEIVNDRGITSRARLTILVNRVPVAIGDTAYIQGTGSITLDVLSNDQDGDGNLLSLDAPAIVRLPAFGTASVHSDGRRIVYTTTAAQHDSFTYAIVDGADGKAVGTVTIRLNRTPVAVADSGVVISTPGAGVDINVTGNDTDPDGDAIRLVANPLRTYPARGGVLRKNDSTVTYYPQTGSSGADSFTVEISDGRGGSAVGTVSVNVCTGPPVISAHPVSAAVRRGQSATISVTATGGTLSYQWYRGPSPSITYPVGVNSPNLTVTPNVTEQYWVRVSNGCNSVASVNATVTVVNNPPIARLTFGCKSNDCDFSSATSTDDGTIASAAWTWSFEPATVTPGSSVRRYIPNGCHTATLSVTDNEGARTSTYQTFAAGDYRPQFPYRAGGANIDTHATSYAPSLTTPGAGLFNTSGNLNGILEPGERVVVEPTWQVAASPQQYLSSATISSSSASIRGSLLDKDALYSAAQGYSNCWATGDCYVVEAAANGARQTPHIDLYLSETTALPKPAGAAVIHVGNSFNDVPPSVWYYGLVESITHAGLTNGCGSGNFCPTMDMNRAMVAIWLLTAKYGAGYQPPPCNPNDPPFNDVPCSYWAAPWIARLKAEGITGGTGGGNYSPENKLSRGEMAVFILRTINSGGYQPPACSTSPYKDVPCSHWAASWIAELKARNMAPSCGADQYCPDTPTMNRVDAAYFMYLGFSLALDRKICSGVPIHRSATDVPLPDPQIIASHAPFGPEWSAANVLDDNVSTDYTSNAGGPNTFIDFDFGRVARITEVSVTDRRSAGGTNGSGVAGTVSNVTALQFIFSTDATFGNGDDVTVPVSSAACCDTVTTALNGGNGISARYVRYDVTEVSGYWHCGAAEIAFKAFAEPVFIQAPTSSSVTTDDAETVEGSAIIDVPPSGGGSAGGADPAPPPDGEPRELLEIPSGRFRSDLAASPR